MYDLVACAFIEHLELFTYCRAKCLVHGTNCGRSNVANVLTKDEVKMFLGNAPRSATFIELKPPHFYKPVSCFAFTTL